MEQYEGFTSELEIIARHFDGKRHGGIQLPHSTAIMNEVLRDLGAIGVSYRGPEEVAVWFPGDEKPEIFTEEAIHAMILAHCVGAEA